MTAIMPKDEAQKLLDEVSDSRHWVKSGRALKEMQNAAPNLARSLIAAHDEMERLRADAQAAVALVVERAEEAVRQAWLIDSDDANNFPDEAADHIRALAPTDGLALVAELRAERDAAASTLAYCEKQWTDTDRVTHAKMLEERARADRLAADNARLAAQVQALTGALKEAGDYLEACKVNGLPDLGAASRMPFLDDVIANVDAALTLARSLIAAHDEMERLRADNARLAAQLGALTGALERVGSGEGMTGTFAIRQNTQEGSELMARMKYARAALEAATLAAMNPAERADYDLTMRIRGAAGDIAKAQIAAREDGE